MDIIFSWLSFLAPYWLAGWLLIAFIPANNNRQINKAGDGSATEDLSSLCVVTRIYAKQEEMIREETNFKTMPIM